MAPDPAPYGAGLPRVLRKLESVTRKPYFGLRNVILDYGEASSILAAAEGGGRLLAAADQTTASLRAENAALREVVEAVREFCARNDDVRTCRYSAAWDLAADVLSLLPTAPTKDHG